MAKSTHSQEVLTGTSQSFTDHELSDPDPPVVIRRAELGRVDQLAGTDSSESSESERQSSEPLKLSPQEPAQTTENLSDQTDEMDSSAPSTGGSGRRTTPPRSGRKRANVRSISNEDDDFD